MYLKCSHLQAIEAVIDFEIALYNNHQQKHNQIEYNGAEAPPCEVTLLQKMKTTFKITNNFATKSTSFLPATPTQILIARPIKMNSASATTPKIKGGHGMNAHQNQNEKRVFVV